MQTLIIGNIYQLANDPYHYGNYLCAECDDTIEGVAFQIETDYLPASYLCVSCGVHHH
jgi:DNA-directed RNA polymerase subunit RPC12/RpoP